jgi:hypothetical protein
MKNVSVERARLMTRLVLEATLERARMRRIGIDSDADIMGDIAYRCVGEKWCARGQAEEGLPVDHEQKLGVLW